MPSEPTLAALGIDAAKTHPDRARWIKYRLSGATVYQSPRGHCFTDHLDHVEAISPEVDERALTPWVESYLSEELSSNRLRIDAHVAIASRLVPNASARVLDVGAGTGSFLSAMRARGAEVTGIELSDASVLYARKHHRLTLHKRALGDAVWESQRASFDLVTLWDVLEHVDFPERTLREAALLLKPGGYVALDTPSRDGTFHRVGDLSYRLSMGRAPTLLNLMYSNHAFGHKQILSLQELRELLEGAGLQVESVERIHELALPTEAYLQKLFDSERVGALVPVTRLAMRVLKPWNKARAIARKM